MRKKILTGVIAFSMIFSVSTNIFADPISDQIQQQQDIINQNRNKVNEINKATQSIESSIESLDESIGTANEKIASNKTQIASTKIGIEKAQQDIVVAQTKMDEEQKLFDDRMRAVYINGNDSVNGYVAILLESKGMSDFLSRIEAAKKLAELDKKILADLKSQQDVVKNKKESLNTDKVKLEALMSENEVKLAKLNSDRQAQVVLVNKAKQEASKYMASITSANSLIKTIRDSVPRLDPSRGAAPISSNAIVAYASNYIGTPYSYGANGPSSFDCSGFTKYVFAHFGVNLNRVAVDQASQGVSVSKDNLEAGDLVFFGSSMSTIHHVGIYVGSGCYINAPYTGSTVQVSSLSRTDFLCAKRVY